MKIEDVDEWLCTVGWPELPRCPNCGGDLEEVGSESVSIICIECDISSSMTLYGPHWDTDTALKAFYKVYEGGEWRD